ncbi:MAG: hypothetical protein Q7T01_01340 [bacterium]|nr:hypothetical protein [bacterium]
MQEGHERGGDDTIVERAYAMRRDGQLLQAQRLLEDAAKRYPRSPRVALAQSDTAIQLNQFAVALRAARRGIATNRDAERAEWHLALLINAGTAARVLQRFDEAQEFLDTAFRIEEHHPLVNLQLASIAEQTRRPEEAARFALRAIANARKLPDSERRILLGASAILNAETVAPRATRTQRAVAAAVRIICGDAALIVRRQRLLRLFDLQLTPIERRAAGTLTHLLGSA